MHLRRKIVFGFILIKLLHEVYRLENKNAH